DTNGPVGNLPVEENPTPQSRLRHVSRLRQRIVEPNFSPIRKFALADAGQSRVNSKLKIPENKMNLRAHGRGWNTMPCSLTMSISYCAGFTFVQRIFSMTRLRANCPSFQTISSTIAPATRYSSTPCIDRSPVRGTA